MMWGRIMNPICPACDGLTIVHHDAGQLVLHLLLIENATLREEVNFIYSNFFKDWHFSYLIFVKIQNAPHYVILKLRFC